MDKSVSLIKSVFMSANEGIIISNRQGEIVAANPRAVEMFGYKAGELEDSPITALVPRQIKGQHKELREKYFKNPAPRPMGIGKELHGLKKDGNVFPLEISLSHFVENENEFVAAFITDITERKSLEEVKLNYLKELETKVKERTLELEKLNEGLKKEIKERKIIETALKESQQLYELIATNFPNGSVNILDADLKYLFSGGADLIFHKEAASGMLIGNSILDSLPKNLRELLSVYLQNGLKGISSSCEFEISNKNVIMHTVPIENDQQDIDKILVVMENITEQKNAEKEVRNALEKERELNEMKSRFVSMASHEFRTPLATILSSTSLLARYSEASQPEKMDKHFGRIKSNIKNLTDILNDFLSLEKLESGGMEVVLKKLDISHFIDDLVEETTPILKEGQYFEVIKNCIESEINTDCKILRNILLNIISNASKYSEAGQKIIMEFSCNQNVFDITVTDEGMGIPKAEQENMFERFFRAKNASNIQGTGLGLFIVNKYVSLLNGKLKLESEEGVGTIIKIRLPYE